MRDGDHYIVNGQKVWTSYGDKADWIFALVRTDPKAKKQDGITFLLIDMETPGVSVRPIQLISGSSPFCETLFDDVRVPEKNVVGKVNSGWTVAKALLGHERSMIADAFGASARRQEERGEGSRSRSSRASTARRGRARSPTPCCATRSRSSRWTRAPSMLTVQRAATPRRPATSPGRESSIFKVYGTELNKRRHELLVRDRGPQGLGWEGPGFDDDELELTREWLRSRGNSIEGGTSEVQLNIIAKRVLGLPD